jgi:23S rRNA pseudouridine2605 synthase
MSERLQKILAQAGLGSRRACEELIRQGRVTVNGQRAQLGCKVDPSLDEVRVDGERLRGPEKPTYILINKPAGVLSSLRSQGGKRTVRNLVPITTRVYPVGRLDVESEGLMLLTNDGMVAHRLTHPRFGCEKEYRVLLDRIPDGKQLSAWQRGMVLADGSRTEPARVWRESQGAKPDAPWLRVVMREGRKRQIREVARSLGLEVKRLVRVRIDGLHLGALKSGEWRRLGDEEAQRLVRQAAKLGARTAGGSK